MTIVKLEGAGIFPKANSSTSATVGATQGNMMTERHEKTWIFPKAISSTCSTAVDT